MKKIYILPFLLFATPFFAQQTITNCPPNPNQNTEQFCEEGKGIRTNPDDLNNPECPDLKNNFDWRAQTPTSTEWYPIIGPNGSQFNIQNPFTGPNDAFYFPYVSAQQGSNYNPEDGWELLSAQLGTYGNIDVNNIDGWHPNMPNSSHPILPYIMLYNKYSGTLRFFGALLSNLGSFNNFKIDLAVSQHADLGSGMPPRNYNSELKTTNLLSIQGKAMQPLDQETSKTAMSVFVPNPKNSNNFFWFDVPLAYDPCVCNNKVQFEVTFSELREADIQVSGITSSRIYGSLNYGNPSFGPLVTGLDANFKIDEGGSLIPTGSFLRLAEYFSMHPSTSDSERTNLESLKDILACSSEIPQLIRNHYTASETEKKKHQAAIDIFDANTTFFASLTNGCFSKDNAATSITSRLKASGEPIRWHPLNDSKIFLALPGSNWSDERLQFNDYVGNNGILVPAYPTYNERLGVLALLETPKVKIERAGSHRICKGNPQSGGIVCNDYGRVRIDLMESLNYTFNPVLNVNLEESQIYCRFVIRDENNASWLDTSSKNHFFSHTPNSLYPVSSEFIPIEYFRNSSFSFIDIFNFHNTKTFSGNESEKLYLQMKVLLQSNDLGKDETPNSSYHIFTFPVHIESYNVADFRDFSAFSDLDAIKYFNRDNVFDVDTMFVGNAILFFNGNVTINAKLTSAPGSTVKIYATNQIVSLENAVIDENIELIVGHPFEEESMLPASFQEVTSFCNSTKYKAQYETAQAESSQRIGNLEVFDINVRPNPNNGNFVLGFPQETTSKTSITISSARGEVVFQKTIREGNIALEVDVSHLLNGVYFITYDDGINRASKKLVLNK